VLSGCMILKFGVGTLVTYNLLPISSGVMSASTKSGRSFGKAHFNLYLNVNLHLP
jgi:hypothetical protein